MKLLIDTGANKSFISPEAVKNFFSCYQLKYDPFVVTNIHATSRNDYSVTVPCFSEFNDQNPIKLYVYRFHEYFDGLIGLDLLEQWQSKIDLGSRVLKTQHAENPILMYKSGSLNLFETVIPAQSTKLIKVPTNISAGDICIEPQTICGCNITSCFSSAENNQAYIEISNPSQNDIIFTLSEPLQVQIFNEQTNLPNTMDCMTHDAERFREVLSRLRTDHMNAEERANLLALCKEYSDIFYLDDEPLTFTNRIKHRISTTDEIPVHSKTYRYPFVHRQEVQSQIKKMLDQGIIRPSTSAWSAPIWVVPKKADASGKTKWRLVVDFRKLNEKTVDDKYPIPNLTDILDKLGKCQYFTTLDLASGFYQVEMHPDDIHKTGFSVADGQGHFEFLRMPMGLKNSPSTFQRVMDNVLRGLQNSICVVYLDDILVFSTSLQEHMINLRKIFDRLRDSNFKVQMDKSEFLKHETPYLGHIITPQGVKPNPDKIAAILKYPIPRTTKQIKGFLGLIGYYRRFIPDFARLTKPLTACLKKGSKISLTPDYVKCFEDCKTLLINDPILQYPDLSKDFILTTDASNVALGAVLSQGSIGSDRPVAYASRTLNDSEMNYSTIEKELLAIVWATKYFRPYLFGRKFKIITDHKPLQWLLNLREPNSRLTRWRLKLAEYNFTIIYKKGKANTNADALSRVEIHNEELDSVVVNISDSSSSIPIIQIDDSSSSTVTAPDDRPLISQSSTDTAPSMRPLYSPLPENNDDLPFLPDLDDGTAHTSVEHPILELPVSEDPLNKFKRQLIIKVNPNPCDARPKTTIPFETFRKTIVQISENNLEQDILSVIKNHIDPKLRTAILVQPLNKMYEIVPILQNSLKNNAVNLVLVKKEIQDICDFLNQQDIISKYHEGKTNHRGINETHLALSERYFWPKLKDSIAKYINQCDICNRAKYDRDPVQPKFQIVPPPHKPYQVAHADVLTIEQDKYLTVIDAFTKYAQVYRLPDCTAPNVVKALLTFSAHHGFPLCLVTDQGTEFTNQVVSEFLKLHKVQHHKIAAHAPNENGMIERFHSTLLEHVRLLKLQHKNEPTQNLIPYAIIAYNSSIHSLTKCRPFDLITGHFDPRNPTDLNLSERLLQQYSQEHRSKMDTVYNIVHDTSYADRAAIMERRNLDREPEIQYNQDQTVYVKNPAAARQKTAPRYTQDKVVTNLPIHIYTSKKRGPVAKTRLKREKKNKDVTLLQDSPSHGEPRPSTSRSTDPKLNPT